MDWLQTFQTDLAEAFGWAPPQSAEELEARLTSGAFFLEVPDVLWSYACGQRQFSQNYPEDPWGNMVGNLFHQGSVRPETALAIPFVLRIALQYSGPHREVLVLDALYFGLGDESWHLPWGCPVDEQVEDGGHDPYFGIACYNALKRQSATIRILGEDDDTDVQILVVFLLGFLPSDPENARFVRAAWQSANPPVRRVAFISLAVSGVEMTPEELQILEREFVSRDEVTSICSAIALAIVALRNKQSPSDALLEKICATENYYWTNGHLLDIFPETMLDSEQVVYTLLNEWEEIEPERVEARRFER